MADQVKNIRTSEILPNTATFPLKKAVQFAEQKKFKFAFGFCKLALLKQPNDYFVNLWYAIILYHLKFDKKSCRYYKKAIKIDSGYSFAHYGLGRLHFENVMAYLRANLLSGAPDSLMFCKDSITESLPGDSDYDGLSLSGNNAEEQCCNRRTAMKELKKTVFLTKDANEYKMALYMIGELFRLDYEWGKNEADAKKIKAIIEEASKKILNNTELEQVFDKINKLGPT